MSSETNYRAKTNYQQKNVAEAYDKERFISWYGGVAHRAELRALVDALTHHCAGNGSILDLPCGTGRLLSAYDDRYQVTGGDISSEMLDVARRRFADNSRYTFERCDAEKLPFADNSFDYVVSFRLMCHLPREIRIRVLSEMARVARRTLVINYHFAVNSPLMIFNRLFRKNAAFLPYPLKERDLASETAGCGVDVVRVRKLTWYERSSAMVILNKRQSGLRPQPKMEPARPDPG